MAYYQLEIVINLQRIHVFVNKSSNSEMKIQNLSPILGNPRLSGHSCLTSPKSLSNFELTVEFQY